MCAGTSVRQQARRSRRCVRNKGARSSAGGDGLGMLEQRKQSKIGNSGSARKGGTRVGPDVADMCLTPTSSPQRRSLVAAVRSGSPRKENPQKRPKLASPRALLPDSDDDDDENDDACDDVSDDDVAEEKEEDVISLVPVPQENVFEFTDEEPSQRLRTQQQQRQQRRPRRALRQRQASPEMAATDDKPAVRTSGLRRTTTQSRTTTEQRSAQPSNARPTRPSTRASTRIRQRQQQQQQQQQQRNDAPPIDLVANEHYCSTALLPQVAEVVDTLIPQPPATATKSQQSKPCGIRQCKCAAGKAGKCWKTFGAGTLESLRCQVFELSQHDRRRMVQSIVSTSLKVPPWQVGNGRDDAPCEDGWQEHVPDRSRLTIDYRVLGVPLCREGFRNVLGIGGRVIKEATRDVKAGVIVPRPSLHGQHLKGRGVFTAQRVVHFIKWVASMHGLPNPAGRGAKVLLPISLSRAQLHKRYQSATGDQTSLATFKRVWAKYLKHIGHAKTRTDVCDTCSKLKSGKMWEFLIQHLKMAKAERKFMNDWTEFGGKADHHVISFDMAGTTRLPHFLEQRKAFYYESGLKVEAFGVTDLARRTQMNYVWHEQDSPKVRGANLIVSLVYHRLTSIGRRDVLYAMADNCGAQNKNWTFLFFFASYAHVFKCSVYYHFLLQGHTKGLHDAFFGLVKRKLKTEDVFTPTQFMDIVERSSVANAVTNAASVPIYNHTARLGLLFCQQKQLKPTKYKHFFFDKDRLGVVRYRASTSDEWAEVNLLRPGVGPEHIHAGIFTDGERVPTITLSAKRHEQLRNIKENFFHGVEHLKDHYYREQP